MKFFKRFLYLFLLLLVLFSALLLLCAVKPEFADSIAGLLYEKEEGRPSEKEAAPPGTAPGPKTADSAESGDATGGGADEASQLPKEYVTPRKADIKTPREVAGKNGYQAPEEKRKQIEDAEAYQLQRQLGCGETGDGLTFDPLFYPYYAMLDEHGQHIYRQVYANAQVLRKSFAPVEPIMAEEIKSVMEAIYNDHPELFWLNTAYACVCKENGQCIELDLEFNKTANNLTASKEKWENASQAILTGASELGSDADKEKYVHDRLVDQISYSLGAELNQSAYSGLVGGRTVCAGYARAFQYLMQELGVPCYYCTGYAGESHAWNIIRLDDDFYNVDVTWDDTDVSTYDYYNKSDADYADTHIRQDMSVRLPPCNGTGYQAESAKEAGLMSLEEAGFSEDQVLKSLGDYYVDCYSQMADLEKGRHTFQNVIDGEELLAQWEQAYHSNEYKDAYVRDAMELIGASSCQIKLKAEQLKGNRYLITHEVNLR